MELKRSNLSNNKVFARYMSFIRCYTTFSKIFFFSTLNLKQRRQAFNPTSIHNKIKRNIYSYLCKIKCFEKNWIFDKYLNMSYELKTDIGNNLYYKGEFERREIDFLLDISKLKRKQVVFDIGANIGVHSITLAKKNNEVKVYSFEPSAYTRKILEFNLKINNLKNQITVIPYAISDHLGKAKFYQTIDNAYSSLKDTKRKNVTDTFEVNLMTIDEFVKTENIGKVDLIKIDVEGSENEVVLGGINTLSRLKPEIFIEIYQGINSNRDPGATINFLRDIGYEAYVLIDGKKTPFKEHSDKFYNYYFSFKQ